jgi:hypothetical protein
MTSGPSRRGFLIGSAATLTSTALFPDVARATPDPAFEGPPLARIVDVSQRLPRAAAQWIASQPAAVAGTRADLATLVAAADANVAFGARRLLLHAPVRPALGARNLDAMRAAVRTVPLDGWDLDLAVRDLDVVAPSLALGVRLGVKVVTLVLPAPDPDLSATLARMAEAFPDLQFVVMRAAPGATMRGLATRPHANVWLEVGAVLAQALDGAREIAVLAAQFGANRILWGTHDECDEQLRHLAERLVQVEPALRTALSGGNAAALYQLDAQP